MSVYAVPRLVAQEAFSAQHGMECDREAPEKRKCLLALTQIPHGTLEEEGPKDVLRRQRVNYLEAKDRYGTFRALSGAKDLAPASRMEQRIHFEAGSSAVER